MKSKLMMAICLSSFSLVVSPLAQAQFCGVSNASLTGSYGYVASEAGTVTTTGTTTTSTGASTYSSTNIGQLLGGIAAGNQFAFSGVLTFDGAGNVTASSSALTGTAVATVGTYNVNPDCTVSVSLTDAFGSNTTATKLAGVILGRGAEMDLTSQASLQPPTTTTGSGTTTSRPPCSSTPQISSTEASKA